MKHLLENWSEVKDFFVEPIFPMFDYDGTLTPIVERSKGAKLSENMRQRLKRLIDYCPMGIISGRALEDIKSRVNIEDIYYSGNHGYEISGPQVNFIKDEAKRARPIIEEICDAIKKESSSIKGALVENKGVTASIHYRLVNEADVSKLKRIVKKEVEPYEEKGIVELDRGKKVLEIKPGGEWDKGKAVSLLRRIVNSEEKRFPIYLGDDVTDEDAFIALRGEGLGILVSKKKRESAADLRLSGPSQVEAFLDRLIEILSDRTY